MQGYDLLRCCLATSEWRKMLYLWSALRHCYYTDKERGSEMWNELLKVA